MNTSTTPAVLPKPKSRRRWYWIGGFVMIVLAFPFGYQFVAHWRAEQELQAIYREIEADDPHWRWADLVTQIPPIPDERNAASQVLKVHGLLNTRTLWPGPKWKDELPTGNICLAEDQVLLLRAALAAQLPEALAEARRLKDFSEGRYAVPADRGYDDTIAHIVNHTQPTRTVMYLLQSIATLHGHDRQMEEAAEACLALTNVVLAFNDHPSMYMQLVRNVGKIFIAESVERLLGNGEVSAATLQQLQARMEQEVAFNSLYHGVRGQRALTHLWVEEIKTGKTPSEKAIGGKTRSTVEDHFNDWFPGFNLGGYRQSLRLTNESIRASELPLEVQDAAFTQIDQEADRRLNSRFRPFARSQDKMRQSYRSSQTLLHCAIIGVAAERYRLKHDAWPATLENLVHEGFLNEIARDPFDGRPLRWRRTKTGAVVYSVGRDGIDDGGKLSRILAQAGTDWGIELWDKRHRHLPPPVIAGP